MHISSRASLWMIVCAVPVLTLFCQVSVFSTMDSDFNLKVVWSVQSIELKRLWWYGGKTHRMHQQVLMPLPEQRHQPAALMSHSTFSVLLSKVPCFCLECFKSCPITNSKGSWFWGRGQVCVVYSGGLNQLTSHLTWLQKGSVAWHWQEWRLSVQHKLLIDGHFAF